MLVGYARASLLDPTAERQQAALRGAGCSALFVDDDPAGAARPQLAAALASAQKGDTLVVPSLDRVGRSLSHLVELANDLLERGVELRALSEDVTTAYSRVDGAARWLKALAAFERSAVVERTQIGLMAARLRGAKLGRRPKLTPEQVAFARRLIESGESPASAAKTVGVSTATLYRAIPGGASSTTTQDLFSGLND